MGAQRLNYISNASARASSAPASQKNENGRRAFGKWFEPKVNTRKTPAARQAEKIACVVVQEQKSSFSGLAAKVQPWIKELVAYVKYSPFNRWYRVYKVRKKWLQEKIGPAVQAQVLNKVQFCMKPEVAFRKMQEMWEALKSMKFEIKLPKVPELAFANGNTGKL
ncbi:MAG: hypothetical protein WC488_00075 [Candidatus Micrarchaeia archaeon]